MRNAISHYRSISVSLDNSQRGTSSGNSPSDSFFVERIISALQSPNKSQLAARLDSLASEAEEGLTLTPSLLAVALQRLIRGKDYGSVFVAYEWLADHPLLRNNDSALLSTIKACTGLRKPIQARHLMANLSSPEAAPSAASLLMQSFCVSDRLDLAESLLYEWLHGYSLERDIVVGDPSDIRGKIDSFLSNMNLPLKLLNQNNSGSNSNDLSPTLKSVLSYLPLGSADYLSMSLPSQTAWESLARMYADRRAWRQSLSLLNFLLSLETSASCSSGELFPRASDAIFHSTVRSLCACEQLSLAFGVIESMKSRRRGLPIGVALLSHLFRCTVSQLEDENESDDMSFVSLADSTLNFLVDFSDDVSPARTKTDRYSHFGLVSALITALCKRGNEFSCLLRPCNVDMCCNC